MQPTMIFWPVLVQIALTVIVFILMGARKKAALKSDSVDMTKTPLDNDAWPDEVLKANNNIRNQFQVPVLFYVLCFMFYSIGAVTDTVIYLAWAFVASRIIHAYIHTGSNYVPARFRVFVIGVVTVILMFILAAKALYVG
jgi:hypothetical protein